MDLIDIIYSMHRLKKNFSNIRLQLILSLFILLIALLLLINDYLTALIFHQPFILKESLLFKVTVLLLLVPTLFTKYFYKLKEF